MKNRFKWILIFIIILMTSGCYGNYNLKINSDLSIDEDLELKIDNTNDAYEKTLKIFEENKIDNNKYDVNISSNEVVIKYNDSFSSIEDYILNSKVYKQLFNKLEYNKNNSFIDLYTTENLKIRNQYTNNNGTNLVDLDYIQINVTNPFKVLLTNAESINDNVYSWTINKNDLNKRIQLQFKPNFNKFPYRPVIVGSLILIISIIIIIYAIRRYKNTQSI